MLRLKEYQIYSCGTIFQNKKGMPKNLKKDKEMKRGNIEQCQSQGIHLDGH